MCIASQLLYPLQLYNVFTIFQFYSIDFSSFNVLISLLYYTDISALLYWYLCFTTLISLLYYIYISALLYSYLCFTVLISLLLITIFISLLYYIDISALLYWYLCFTILISLLYCIDIFALPSAAPLDHSWVSQAGLRESSAWRCYWEPGRWWFYLGTTDRWCYPSGRDRTSGQ